MIKYLATANLGNQIKKADEVTKKLDEIAKPTFWQSIDWMNLGKKLLITVIIFMIGKMIINFLVKTLDKVAEKKGATLGIRYFIRKALEVVLFFILITIIMSNLGFKTTSLAAIIGSFGVALALALRESISDIASGIIMVMVKALEVGDVVMLKEDSEFLTVQEIKLFNTTFRNRYNIIVTLPNTQIIQNKIKNLSKNGDYILIDIDVSVAYKSDLKKVREIISETIEKEELVLKGIDYLVGVKKLGDNGIDILVSVPVKIKDSLTLRFSLTENIKNSLEKNGIDIPFPQMELRVLNKQN